MFGDAYRRLVARRLAVAIVTASSVLITAQQPRDAATAPAIGTSVVTGSVVDDQSPPRPLRRVVVTLMGSALGLGRSAITDDNGRFSITQLPAGRVVATASKAGFIEGAFGASRPGGLGTPVELQPDASMSITIGMTRAAVLTGVIRDARGRAQAGLRVFALNARKPVAPEPRRTGTIGRGVLTDDRGIYRLYDLPPGEYIIAVTPAASPTEMVTGDISRHSTEQNDAILARLRARAPATTGFSPPSATPPSTAETPSMLAPVYYNSTATLSGATKVKVGAGEVRGGLDFVVSAVPITTIEGVIVADGPMPASVSLSIAPINTLQFFGLGGLPRLSQPPGADGRFKYTSIVPGRYAIRASANPGAGASDAGGRGSFGPAPPGMLYAIEEVEVTGLGVSGIMLRLQPGARISGRIVAAPDSLPLPDTRRILLELSPLMAGAPFMRPALPNSDGTFEFVDVQPGSFEIQMRALAGSNWWFQSAMANGKDLLDTGLSLRPGDDLSGAVLTVTTRHSGVVGVLQSTSGAAAEGYYVVAMPADPTQWKAGSRRLKYTRPGTDGKFSMIDLPAGEYVLVAVTDVDPDEWQTTEFLRSIATAGVKVAIATGEMKTQDLRIGGR